MTSVHLPDRARLLPSQTVASLRILLAVVGLAWLGAAGSGWAAPSTGDRLYTFVDDDGVLHFTNRPAEANKQDRVKVYEGEEGFGGERPIVIEIKGRRRVVHPVDVSRYDELFRAAAERYRLPFALLKAVAKVESNFDPKAVSHAQAKGLMQLIDATAQKMNVHDPFDPKQAISGGARYLRFLANRFNGDLDRTLAAYNAGPERVERAGGIPEIRETKRYVRRVLQMYRHYRIQDGAR